MNFNASRNVGPSGGIRKAKRVSDVAAMGAPSPTPQYSAAPVSSPGFAPAGPPPPYQEGIQLETTQDYGWSSPTQVPNNVNFGFPPVGMVSPTQIGNMLHQPMVQDMAYTYTQALAAQGGEAVRRGVGRALHAARLRYYFAVDTAYVLRKLLLIVFPFTHKEWMLKYDQESPVQPRFDLNAPDLYIPSMGYVTYVLLAGFMLGLQHRFSPEQISIQASSALAYIIFEMMMYLITLYVTGTNTSLKTLDLLAFSGYKYTTMIGSLLAGLLLGPTGYYCSLVYTSLSLSYFLVKTLRLQMLAGPHGPEQPPAYGYGSPEQPAYGYGGTEQSWRGSGGGTKRRVYFLLFVALLQPLLGWWLTAHLVPPAAPPTAPPPPPVR